MIQMFLTKNKQEILTILQNVLWVEFDTHLNLSQI